MRTHPLPRLLPILLCLAAGAASAEDQPPDFPVQPVTDTAPPAPPPGAAADASPPLPAVPASAAQPAPAPLLPPNPKPRPSTKGAPPAAQPSLGELKGWLDQRRGQAQAGPFAQKDDKGALRVAVGRTYRLPVAIGQLNRIVTPFADPKVLTVSPIETKVEGAVVYVATDSPTPASLFVTDAETSDAVSLELVPQDTAPPLEVRLEMERKGQPVHAGGGGTGGEGPGRAGLEEHPYVAGLKAILRSLALGAVPQGFTLTDPGPAPRAESCAMPGVGFRLGQRLSGTRSDVLVFVAENQGREPVLLDEAACAAPNVQAVGAWPRLRLSPGERTEVYVVVGVAEPPSQEQARPPLIER